MGASISDLPIDDRLQLVGWIGERPETVLAVHALLSGHGRVWTTSDSAGFTAALIESRLVPGEPQGFGDAETLFGLLSTADDWRCVEGDLNLADVMSVGFRRRWGLARQVTDVVHTLDQPIKSRSHPLVRQLSPADAGSLPVARRDVLPDRAIVVEAAELGRVFAAVDDGVIVGHGSSMASGTRYADVGVHVAEEYRRQGIATAAASLACGAVQRAGLTPVWGTGSHNAASLGVSASLGFDEHVRLGFLVRGDV